MSLVQDLANWLNEKLSVGHGGLRAWGLKIHAYSYVGWGLKPVVLPGERSACLMIAVHFTKMPHRDTGEVSGGLETSVSIDARLLTMLAAQGREKAEGHVLEELRHHLLYIASHEIDESLLWDGQRRWDPHLGDEDVKGLGANMIVVDEFVVTEGVVP